MLYVGSLGTSMPFSLSDAHWDMYRMQNFDWTGTLTEAARKLESCLLSQTLPARCAECNNRLPLLCLSFPMQGRGQLLYFLCDSCLCKEVMRTSLCKLWKKITHTPRSVDCWLSRREQSRGWAQFNFQSHSKKPLERALRTLPVHLWIIFLKKYISVQDKTFYYLRNPENVKLSTLLWGDIKDTIVQVPFK